MSPAPTVSSELGTDFSALLDQEEAAVKIKKPAGHEWRGGEEDQ